MPEDQESDYKELLENNVDEVKKRIRDLEAPDLDKILELEEEGKDRKTIKQFIEDRLGDGETDAESEEESAEETVESEDLEVIEDIEEETEGGFLAGFSSPQVLAGGLVLGVIIGLLVGFGANMGGQQMADAATVQNQVTSLFEASGVPAENVEVVSTEKKHGLYYVQVNFTSQGGNQTGESTRSFYVSPDAELLIQPSFFGRSTVYNIQDTIQRMRQQQNQGGNQTQTNETGSQQ